MLLIVVVVSLSYCLVVVVISHFALPHFALLLVQNMSVRLIPRTWMDWCGELGIVLD